MLAAAQFFPVGGVRRNILAGPPVPGRNLLSGIHNSSHTGQNDSTDSLSHYRGAGIV